MSFLQSPEWEQLQNLLGRKTWRIDGALAVRHDLPGGFNYLYSPRPHVVTSNCLLVAGKTARLERSLFLKIDPQQEIRSSKPEIRNSNGIQPRRTAILDLQKPEEELLAAMHEKTRYNIRLAERRGVEAKNFQFPNPNFQSFWGLLRETAERDRFHMHEKSYYEKLLAVRSENFSNELFFAEYEGKILAAAMVNFYKNTATYLHGASSREYRDIMAPHLLHWRIIQEAKRRGVGFYDLWGIDEKRWPGLTRFKTGFGGEIIEYPPSVDVVYRQFLYGVYRLAKRL